MRLVTILALGWWTPRLVMHPWAPSTTTATPCGRSTRSKVLAISAVIRLLNLHALGIDLDDTCQFGNTDNPVARQIADMRPPDDRRHMMLAVGNETNVAQQNHFVIPGDFLECPAQQLVRIFAISGKPLLIGTNDTRAGVSISPSRSGSSPAHRMSVVTACSASSREGRVTGLGGFRWRLNAGTAII
jgi:hypothetical protein